MNRIRILTRTVWAVFGLGLFAAGAAAQTYGVLEFFRSDGSGPYAGLIQATDGHLYGTTFGGGANGYGTIFKTDTNGTTVTTLHSFSSSDGTGPLAGLVQGTDGNLYGTSSGGGASLCGTIFKISTDGSTFTTLHSFSYSEGAGSGAALIQGTDGNLYGTAERGGANGYGTIFKIDTNGSTFTTLHSFSSTDGEYPYASLNQGTDGDLYGTTYRGGTNDYGTIFKIDTTGSTFTTLHSFVGSDGAYATAGLIQGTDANLYGTTSQGGTSFYGTIFKINADGSAFTTLHNFAMTDGAYPRGALIQGTDGNFYGTTFGVGASYGTIFKIDTNGTTLTTLHSFNGSDGANPWAGLIQGTDGNLYGTTLGGGPSNVGTLFKIDTSGAAFTTLHDFGYSDGANPQAGLIQGTDGNLYGTTLQFGVNGYGTVFKIDTNGSTFTTLHSFAYSDGAYPYASLIQGTDGNLYGTTGQGGASVYGTIFKIDTNGSTFTTLHSFAGSDGATPESSLVQGTDGNLYGTTSYGGANNVGTVFKIDTGGTTLTTLHSFANSDGAYPGAGLVQGTDGNLYGATYSGGANSYGTVFKIDTNGSTFTTLHDFASSDGANPYAGLVQGADGNLYGTTAYGGASNVGTIFKIDTGGTTLTTLHSFAGIDGRNPQGVLIQFTDGSLYGTTSTGGAGNCYVGCGTIFKTDANGTTLTTMHTFAGSDGAYPNAGLIQGSDGNLYGTTSFGGPVNGGVVFKIVPCSLSQPPVITPGGPTTFCAGGSVTLDAGAGYASYLWSPGGQTTQTIVVTTSGSYKVTVTDATGCQGTSAPTVVTVNPNPVPVITPGGPTTFCAGGSVTLDAGAGYASYLWSPGGQTTRTIVVTTPGSYTVTVTDANGCVGTSAPVVVTVNPNPSPVITPGGPTTFCAGGSVTLDAGAGYASYLWTPGGQTTQTIVVMTSGSYSVTVTAATGCLGTSAPMVVSVNPTPVPVLTVSHCPPPNTPGLGASVPANAGDTYAWTLAGGTIDSGQGTNAISFTSGGPGTPMSLSVVETAATSCVGAAGDTLQVEFSDVPSSEPFYTFVCAIGRDGITAGCGTGIYCPDNAVTRAQMAVFLLKGEHGASYVPPPATGTVFADVPANAFAAAWIEQLSTEGVTTGCGGGNYCPSNPATRAQMAVFLLKAEHGPGYAPPACHGIFSDVSCPGGFAVDWIEQLSTEGITAGCGGGNYCPDASSTRGQMAVFLARSFGL